MSDLYKEQLIVYTQRYYIYRQQIVVIKKLRMQPNKQTQKKHNHTNIV